jgi:hypothetical protein
MKKLILLLATIVTIILGQSTNYTIGSTIPQVICPKGEHYYVTWDSNSSYSMPIQRCEKIKEKKLKKLKKHTVPKEDKVETVLKIFKYGSPHATGQSFPSRSQCEKEQIRLSKENAGLDYSYKCVRK